MNQIPERIEIRNLVGKELDQIHDDRGADHHIVVEHLELRWKLDPPVASGQSEDGHRGVQVHAGRKREAQRASKCDEVHRLRSFDDSLRRWFHSRGSSAAFTSAGCRRANACNGATGIRP